MSYQVTIGLALGTSKTGLTLEAQPVSTAGANVGSAITTGFVEYGGGQYGWTGSLPDGHTGGVKFQLSGGGAFQAFAAINPPEVENPDVKTSTRSSHTAADVWAVGTRTLTSFGTLVADVWANTTRTLSAFAFSVTVGTNTDKTGYTVSTNQDKTGYSLSSAGVQAIWDALTSALTTAGSIGKQVVDNLNATVSSRSTYSGGPVASVTGDVGGNVVGSVGSVTADVGITQAGADKVWNTASRTLTSMGTLVADVAAAVWGAATRTLSAFGFSVTVATNNDKTGYTVSTVQDKTGYSLATAPPTLTGIVNGVLNEPLSSHTTAGTVGAGISSAGGGGGTDPLANAYPGLYADGTYGAYLRDKLGLIHVDQVVVQNPINPNTNTITLVRGDAYNPATRRLVWTLTGYPDLTGAAVKLSINGGSAITGSVLSTASDDSAQDVAVDVTPTETAALAGSLQPASATVVLASGDPMTYWAGYVDARERAAL